MTELKVDPVCQMKVDPEDPGAVFKHQGVTYYFCSEGCEEEFRSHPEDYLDPKKIAEREAREARELEASGGAEAEFTCPMHPEIRQKGPGSCPICGMALEPVAISLAQSAEANPELTDFTRRFILSAVLTLPLLVFSMGSMSGGHTSEGLEHASWALWIQFVLAAPVVLWGGLAAFRKRVRFISL